MSVHVLHERCRINCGRPGCPQPARSIDVSTITDRTLTRIHQAPWHERKHYVREDESPATTPPLRPAKLWDILVPAICLAGAICVIVLAVSCS